MLAWLLNFKLVIHAWTYLSSNENKVLGTTTITKIDILKWELYLMKLLFK